MNIGGPKEENEENNTRKKVDEKNKSPQPEHNNKRISTARFGGDTEEQSQNVKENDDTNVKRRIFEFEENEKEDEDEDIE